MTPPIVAEVQVAKAVRRPVRFDTFFATEYEDDAVSISVRGHWRGHHEEREYRFPLTSIVGVQIVGGSTQ